MNEYIQQKSRPITVKTVLALVLANFINSTVSIATKYASQYEMFSFHYLSGVIIAVALLGIYAIFWQQILKRTDLSTAYMFKGTGLLFVLLFSAFLFEESITIWNIAGAVLIIGGIVSFAKS